MEKDDLISRKYLLESYDREHVGPPGRARELIANAPAICASDDAISRKKAIDAVVRARCEVQYPVYFAEILKNIPAISQIKKGRWVRKYSRPGVYADLFWHCSECGFKNDYEYAHRHHRFCPGCGALMEATNETD